MIDSICQYIADETGFETGVKLQPWFMAQDAPERAVALMNRSGGSVYHDLSDRVDFMLQVFNRAPDIHDALSDAKVIYDILHGYTWIPLFDIDGRGTNLLTNGNCELWNDINTLSANWVQTIGGTSTVNRETTDVNGGTYSARCDVDALNSQCQLVNTTPSLDIDEEYRLSFWYKITGGSYKIKFQDTGDNVFLQSDATWGADNLITLTETDWTVFAKQFRPNPSYTDYKILFDKNAAASKSFYLDDVYLYLAKYIIHTAEAVAYPQWLGQDEHGRHQYSTNYILRLSDYVTT
jgi:hypothetical protein